MCCGYGNVWPQQLLSIIVYVMILHCHISVWERMNDACFEKHPHCQKCGDIIDVYVQGALHVQVRFTPPCTVGIIDGDLFRTVLLKE